VLLPAHVVAGTDLMADWNDRMWVSGGPFQFEQWSRGEFLTLTRNPAYWKVDGDTGQQLPFLDRVVFRFVGDVDTLVAEFEARRLDVITPGADAALLDRLAALEGVVVDVVGNGQWEHLSFQFGEGRLSRNPGSYNSHLEFRRAVAHAVNRDRVAAELLGSWGVGMDSYVEAFTPGWSQAAWAQYDYDPDAARTALAELCAKPDIDCTTNPPTVVFTTSEQRVALAAVLEPMFTEVGIAFRAELEPRVVFLGETIEYGTFDLAEWSWAGRPGLESLVCLHRVWDPDQVPPLGSNHYRFGSPAYQGEPVTYRQGPSSLINESSARMSELATLLGVDQGCHPSTVDRSELLTLVAEAEQILADELVFIPLYQNPEAGVVWADEVAGYKPNPTGGGDTWNIASWHRIDG
jgi:ABC-type transport system substrate-binding protein